MQLDAAVARLRDGILSTAEADGLTGQAYWLSSTLALGAFLKVSMRGFGPPASVLPPCSHAELAGAGQHTICSGCRVQDDSLPPIRGIRAPLVTATCSNVLQHVPFSTQPS